MKRLFFAMVATVTVSLSFAQSVQEGVKHLYYNRLKSAKETFTKLANSNPADAEANYWLVYTLLLRRDNAAAQAAAAKAVTSTNGAPLALVALGNVELQQGKETEARAHFEQAIAATKSKKNKNLGDATVLGAVARANAFGGSKQGDADYALARAKDAITLNPDNPDFYIIEGVAALKRGAEYGGEAKRAYEGALEKDPNYALAYQRIGKIFESQKNSEIFLENYNKAIQVDPNFSPAYYELYDYYANRDVNKAKEYLDKFVATAEKDRETDYFAADYLFRAGRYQESLNKGKEIEAGLGGEAFPRLNKLYAYNYDRLGDSAKAVEYMEKYMNTEAADNIKGDDYAQMAKSYLKVGAPDKAEAMIEKAITQDTVFDNKMGYMRSLAESYAAGQNYKGQYKWLDRMMQIRPDTTARNFYFITDAAVKAQEFDAAQKLAHLYIQAYPDQPQGYALLLKAAVSADADTSKGTALEAVDIYNNYLMKDTVKNKGRIIQNYGYKIYYYMVKAKDYPKSLEAANAILALDPANSYGLMAQKEATRLMKGGAAPAPSKPSAPKSGSTTKPSSGAAKKK